MTGMNASICEYDIWTLIFIFHLLPCRYEKSQNFCACFSGPGNQFLTQLMQLSVTNNGKTRREFKILMAFVIAQGVLLFVFYYSLNTGKIQLFQSQLSCFSFHLLVATSSLHYVFFGSISRAEFTVCTYVHCQINLESLAQIYAFRNKNRMSLTVIQPILELFKVEKNHIYKKSDYTTVTHC
jgi:hypothetical protein